ncbi:MAG: GGDEF domain-containing protein [Rhodocyclaceae bacterium]|nr:GGDEF domain-containing protein [Rhodocyclaceae bacterium]
MTQEFNLFEAEDRLAQECRALLDGGSLPDETAATLAKLLAGYEHLLRETKQLIRLSDRREKDMNRLNKRLEQLTHSLAYQAEHDFLTGCLNKGAMTARIEAALAARDCGLIVLDIDHFKQVNDRHGHPAGDAVLRGLAELMQEALADHDLVGRMGGEEFAVLLEQPTLIQAKARAEHLRRHIEATPLDAGAQTLPITISLGVTACQRGEAFAAAYARADAALYAAKDGGRNRVASLERPA